MRKSAAAKAAAVIVTAVVPTATAAKVPTTAVNADVENLLLSENTKATENTSNPAPVTQDKDKDKDKAASKPSASPAKQADEVASKSSASPVQEAAAAPSLQEEVATVAVSVSAMKYVERESDDGGGNEKTEDKVSDRVGRRRI